MQNVALSLKFASHPFGSGPKLKNNAQTNAANQIHGDFEFRINKIVDVYQNDYSLANSSRYFADISIEGNFIYLRWIFGPGTHFCLEVNLRN